MGGERSKSRVLRVESNHCLTRLLCPPPQPRSRPPPPGSYSGLLHTAAREAGSSVQIQARCLHPSVALLSHHQYSRPSTLSPYYTPPRGHPSFPLKGPAVPNSLSPLGPAHAVPSAKNTPSHPHSTSSGQLLALSRWQLP